MKETALRDPPAPQIIAVEDFVVERIPAKGKNCEMPYQMNDSSNVSTPDYMNHNDSSYALNHLSSSSESVSLDQFSLSIIGCIFQENNV